MAEYKDNFSSQSSLYAQYRPSYPTQIFDFLKEVCLERKLAWDCATGNGQVAMGLSSFFDKVIATDASQAQLDKAMQASNITYKQAIAESSGLEDHSIDLITVGQALHWFDFEKFYAEARRVSKPNAVIAVWGYGLHRIDTLVDSVIDHFYTQIIGPYWDAERKHIDQGYQTIPFDFELIPSPTFQMQLNWDFQALIGYLNTWSSVQKYIREKNQNPVELIHTDLAKAWGEPEAKKQITWEIYFKAGKVK